MMVRKHKTMSKVLAVVILLTIIPIVINITLLGRTTGFIHAIDNKWENTEPSKNSFLRDSKSNTNSLNNAYSRGSSDFISNITGIWYLRHLRVRHGQTGGDIDDWIGSLRISPPSEEEYRWCGLWTDYFLDENLSGSQVFNNIYFHVWSRIRDNKSMWETIGWHYSNTQYKNYTTNCLMAIHFDQQTRYALSTSLLDVNLTLSPSQSYKFKVRHEQPDYGHGELGGGVMELSSYHSPSFVIMNVPSNNTLNSTGLKDLGSDTDMDGLTDWQELYEYYTNPYDKDTDHDEWDDYYEAKTTHTNPNNWDCDNDDLPDGLDPNPTVTRYTHKKEWIVSSDTTLTNGGYIMSGNVTIKSGVTLTLNNFNIILNTIDEKTLYQYEIRMEHNTTLRGNGLVRTNNGNRTSSIKMQYDGIIEGIETRYVKIEINGNNCTIRDCTLMGNQEFVGVYINPNRNHNLIINNTFKNGQHGVLFFKAHNNIIKNSRFWYTSIPLKTMSSSDFNSLLNSTIEGGGKYSIHIRGKYNRIENITIIESKSGPYLLDNSENTKIKDVKILTSTYGIIFKNTNYNYVQNTILRNLNIALDSSYASKNNITNSTIEHSGLYDIRLLSSDIILLNSTFETNKVQIFDQSSKLIVKWFLDVKVVDKNGNHQALANVRIQENENGTFDENYSTDFQGWVKEVVCIEYLRNLTNTIYYTPHTITATKNGISNKINVGMNNNKKITITLDVILPPTPPIVISTSPDNGEEDVRIDTVITIEFSKPMKRTTVEDAISISGDSTLTFFWSDNDRIATVSLPSNLSYNMQYIITINGTTAEDVNGSKLDGNKDGIGGDDYTWSFKTEAGMVSSNEFSAGYLWLIFSLAIIAIMVVAIALVARKKGVRKIKEEKRK